MKYLLMIITVLVFLSMNTNAQLSPAQSQYLIEKGVFINPDFEQGYKGWDFTGNTCVKSLEQRVPFLNKSLKMVCTNQTLSVKQNSDKFVGASGGILASVRVETDVDIKLETLANDVQSLERTVFANTALKEYEIADVIDANSNGMRIFSEGNITATIYIDDYSLGFLPKGYLTEVNQSQFVGSLTYQESGCTWSTTSTSFSGFPVDSDCDASNIIGDVTAPDIKIPAIKIPNSRTDGYYKVVVQGLVNSAGTSFATLSNSSNYENQGVVYVDSATNSDNQIVGNFKFQTSGDKQIQVIGKSNGTNNLNFYGGGGPADFASKFTVHFFPDSTSTIVTQDTELTAKTANDLTVRLDSSCNVISKNYDWITSTSINGGTRCALNFSGLGLTEIPSIKATAIFSGAGQFVSINSANISTNSAEFFAINASNVTALAEELHITVSKQGADVNKSQTLVANLSQIEEVDAELDASTDNFFRANISTFDGSVSLENYDFIDSCTGSSGFMDCDFVDGIFSLEPNCTPTASSISNFGANVRNVTTSGFELRTFNSSSNVSPAGVVSIKCDRQGADYNKSVKGVVVRESEIQKTEYADRKLTTSVTSTGTISELTVNNLEIGATYEVYGSGRCLATTAVNNFKRCFVSGNQGNVLSDVNITTSNTSMSFPFIGVFTATSSTFTVGASILSNFEIDNLSFTVKKRNETYQAFD